MSKKLLIIGWVWPEPRSSAAGSRMLQLIDFFKAQSVDLTFASPAQTTPHMIDLAEYGVSTQAITLNCASFDDFIQQLQPDMVLYDRYMMEEQFGWRVAKYCPNALRILDTEDLQSLRNARHQAFKQGKPLAQMDYYTELAVRELAAIYRCDLTIMISKAEIDLLVNHYGVDPKLLVYLPFMLDLGELATNLPSFNERQHFISIGNFRHAPNWDAVLWLKQQIWPLIRKQLPQAELHIYGAYPPKKATDLHDVKSGFLVKGWVDDAYQVMKQARVCLAPLRFGAGLKGKLLDAMVCGTPSITTTIGAEGMTINTEPSKSNNNWCGKVADDTKSIAEHAVKLYQQEEDWQQASILSEKKVKQLFDRQQHWQVFSDTLEAITANLAQHRQANFVGLMLNHHHHKSTQYMSQWIAAKNQLNKSN